MIDPKDPDFWPKYDALSPGQLSELDAEAADEARYGTPAEQAADAVEAEAEAIVAAAWAAYGTDSYVISSPDDLDEPEADL